MKLFFTLLISIVSLGSFGNQQQQTGIDEVIAALKLGNTAQMALQFDSQVEVIIGTQTNRYNKSQAEAAVKSFFATNPVKGFTILHKGDKGGAQFCIGTLSTRAGNYRTTIFMKQKGDKQVLQEIRFEN